MPFKQKMTHCCPLCEVDLTDTKTLQWEDKHYIKISKLIADPKSRFHERDSYGYDDKGILYHTNRENGREIQGNSGTKSPCQNCTQGNA